MLVPLFSYTQEKKQDLSQTVVRLSDKVGKLVALKQSLITLTHGKWPIR